MRASLLCIVLLIAASVKANGETLLERGSYLVNAVMACDTCHTPRGPTGLIMEQRFSGGSQTWDEPTYRVKGANITPDRHTGIGTWSDHDIKRALTEGVRPNGVPLASIMPFTFYKILTPRDLDAVVAYLRSIAPVHNAVQTPVYKAAMPVVLVPGAEKPLPEEAMHDPVTRGFYVTTIAHCMECHARRPDGIQDYQDWPGKGGHEMQGPYGTVMVANITSHPTSGIGAWSDAEITRALTQGRTRDDRPFTQPMARATYFSRMTQADLDTLVAYLRTLPPLE